MKIVMIFDQIQSGMGTKDDAMLALSGKKTAIGPAIMMEKDLAEVDGKILACLYCGSTYYRMNQHEVTHKICAMIHKLHPDVVICGPAYDDSDYAYMCASIANELSIASIPVVAAMAQENHEVIAKYKNQFPIVRTPAKGGVGLHQSLHNICIIAKQLADGEMDEELRNKVCF